MLYTGTSVDLLIGRIGWAQAVPPTALVVDAPNLISNSGLYFNSFHELVTAENVNDCIRNLNIDVANLNTQLAKMKKDSVLEVLNKVFDLNVLANYHTSVGVVSTNYNADGYDDMIASKLGVFDACIGYSMSVRGLQLFIASERSNGTQRKMKAAYPYLKSELEGINDTDGNTMSSGANVQFTRSIKDAIEVLFPTTSKNDKIFLRDKTNIW